GGKGRYENGSRPTRFGSRKISAGKRVKLSPTWPRDTESLTRRTRQRHSVPLLLTSKRRSAASPNRSTYGIDNDSVCLGENCGKGVNDRLTERDSRTLRESL